MRPPINLLNDSSHCRGWNSLPRSLIYVILDKIQHGALIGSWLRQHYLASLHECDLFRFLTLTFQPASLAFVSSYPESQPRLNQPMSRVEISFQKPNHLKLECLSYYSCKH